MGAEGVLVCEVWERLGDEAARKPTADEVVCRREVRVYYGRKSLDWQSGDLNSRAASATLTVCLGVCQLIAVIVRCGGWTK